MMGAGLLDAHSSNRDGTLHMTPPKLGNILSTNIFYYVTLVLYLTLDSSRDQI